MLSQENNDGDEPPMGFKRVVTWQTKLLAIELEVFPVYLEGKKYLIGTDLATSDMGKKNPMSIE